MSSEAPVDVEPTLQAVAALPPNLQQNVLRRIPLPNTLRNLPATFHPTALRAHHPSIATHNFLHLHPIPIDLMPTALHAAATLSHLLSVSLAGATLPRPPSHSIRLLKPLSGITSLSLRGTGLSDDAATALAGTLPCFPGLQTLDLSGNCIMRDAMLELAAGITLCATLQSLNMSGTLSLGSRCTGDSLAAALSALRSLTSLRVGEWKPCGLQLQGQADFRGHAQHALWSAVRGLPELAVLQVDVDQGDKPGEGAADVAAAVATLTRLEHLRLVVQVCTDRPDSEEGTAGAETDAPTCAQQSELAASMQQLSLLTSVDLEFSSTAVYSANELTKVQAGAATLLASLSGLRQLRRLSCKVPIRRDHAKADPPCKALAEALPSLAQLTHLGLRAGHTDRYHTVLVEPSLASVVAVVRAAVRLPQLRALHVPVSAVQEDGQLVATLLSATHICHLTLDLFVHAMGEGQDEPWQHGVDVYVPLFPNVTALSVWAHGGEESLWPILSHVTALQQLRTLTIEAMGFEWWSAANREQAQSMGGTRCLSQLTRLTCLHLLLDSFSNPIDTQSLTQAVAGMPSLQHLTWDVVSLNEAVLIPNELLEAFLRMPGLQVLNMGEFQVGQADMCMKVLPQLPLAELEVQIRLDRDMQPLAGVVQELRHLRCLAMPECRVEGVVRAMRGATAALPSFEKLICSPLR